MKRARLAAFTLIELLMAAGASVLLASIIYTVASEGLYSFARNASINRAFSEARTSIDHITANLQTAGYTPVLVDATGAVTTSPTAAAAGVRFYRYIGLPVYDIPSGTTSGSTLVIHYSGYQTPTGSGSPVLVGDLMTIPLLGFQATVASVVVGTRNGDGSGQVTLSFSTPPANPYYVTTGSSTTPYTAAVGTIANYCSPPLPVDSTGKPLTTSFAYPATTTNLTTGAVTSSSTSTSVPAYYTCLVFRQVAYIAVPNNPSIGGAQLRYYPQAMSSVSGGTASGGVTSLNGTAFNTASSYTVLANLYAGVVTLPTSSPAVNPLLPFQIVITPPTTSGSGTTATTNAAAASTTLNIAICENGPDYSNRNLGMANTFSLMRSSTSSRCPILLHATTNTVF